VAAAITPDGKRLIAANHLHAGRRTTCMPGGNSAIDTVAGRVEKTIPLTEGAVCWGGCLA
jgi:hypothetical protein